MNALAFILASTSGVNLFDSKMELGDFITLSIALVVFIAGIASIAFILWGGVLLILSGGKEDKIKPAINSIRYSLVGILLIVISIFIFPRLGALLGLDVNRYASPDKIFMTIKQVGNKVLGNERQGIDNLNSIDALGDDFLNLDI